MVTTCPAAIGQTGAAPSRLLDITDAGFVTASSGGDLGSPGSLQAGSGRRRVRPSLRLVQPEDEADSET